MKEKIVQKNESVQFMMLKDLLEDPKTLQVADEKFQVKLEQHVLNGWQFMRYQPLFYSLVDSAFPLDDNSGQIIGPRRNLEQKFEKYLEGDEVLKTHATSILFFVDHLFKK